MHLFNQAGRPSASKKCGCYQSPAFVPWQDCPAMHEFEHRWIISHIALLKVPAIRCLSDVIAAASSFTSPTSTASASCMRGA